MKTVYTQKELIGILVAYYRMIKRDNRQFNAVVIDDLEKSLEYVLTQCGYDFKKGGIKQ